MRLVWRVYEMGMGVYRIFSASAITHEQGRRVYQCKFNSKQILKSSCLVFQFQALNPGAFNTG